MSDLISRQAAIDLLKQMRKDGDMIPWEGKDVFARIRKLPSAQPEQRTGKWNTYYHGVNENPSFTYSCNQCGHSAPYGLYGGKYSQKKWAYCPNCGARMKEGD